MSDSKTSTDAIHVPAAVGRLATSASAAGGRAYLVGGSVRDALLGRPSKDLDIEVFGLPVDELEGLLRRSGRVDAVGRSFGVLKWRPRGSPELGELDVSIPRRDSKEGRGHRGISVEGDPDMTIDEAVRRRDLTINAMMFDVLDGDLVDPSGGADDLRRGVLRAVDESTFLEDPLRALRVVQFVARLGFVPDSSLLNLCRAAALDELPPERVQGEWRKLLLKGVHIACGLRVAAETEILARVFPEWSSADPGTRLDALCDPRERILQHEQGEGRAWALMLCGWLAGASTDTGVAILDRLRLHRVGRYPVRERTLAALSALTRPLDDDAAIRNLAAVAEVETVAHVRHALGDPDARAALRRAATLGVLHDKPPALLQGRDISGLVPKGPKMGRLLRAVYQAQLDGRVQTKKEARDLAADLSSTTDSQ